MSYKESYSRPFLAYPLDEFRTALEDEIEVAKRNESGNAIQLFNGRKVGVLVGFFHYAFKMDSLLNRPDGMPGELFVPGKKNPLSVSIVSTEGIDIVLSIEADLGEFIPSARLQANLTILMRKLIERIETKGDSKHPAGLRMMGEESLVLGAPETVRDRKTLNDRQLQALESALGRNLTVIWGPPGTGKTHVIGTISEHLHKKDRTVLIVSHTNTAVDQAIRHIAKALKDENMEIGGVVLRIGDPKGEELKGEYEEVILKKQVEIQSQVLYADRERFLRQKEFLSDELVRLDWMITSDRDIQTIGPLIEEIERLCALIDKNNLEYEKISNQIPLYRKIKGQTDYILQLRNEFGKVLEQLTLNHTELKERQKEVDLGIQTLADHEERVKGAMKILPIIEERKQYPPQAEQKEKISLLSQKIEELSDQRTALLAEIALQKSILDDTKNAGKLERLVKRMPKIEEQKGIVDKLMRGLSNQDVESEATQRAKEYAVSKLAQIIEMDVEIGRYEGIMSVESELKTKEIVFRALDEKKRQKQVLEERTFELKTHAREIRKKVGEYSKAYEGQVEKKSKEASIILQQYEELSGFLEENKRKRKVKQEMITGLLERLSEDAKGLDPEKEWFDDQYEDASDIDRAEILLEFHKSLRKRMGLYDLEAVQSRKSEYLGRLQSISSEIRQIDIILQGVEKEIIQNASIIGATLTKTYLSDDIQTREFDTVVLDEASMAPIPALWMAGQLSRNNLVIVGDFRQIPPIVLSDKELTKKWLGRDVFQASGIQERWETGENIPDYFFPLNIQRRMVKEIADIASFHFYDGMIETDSVAVHEKKKEFTHWFPVKHQVDASPVVLLDMGPANAWVTSEVKGGNTSRLNFLSASISVDLAKEIQREAELSGNGHSQNRRILIISPYRAHANLVTVLLESDRKGKKEDVKQMISSGTTHNFQGSEADIVVFDLVVDEPHFRVNLFIPGLDDQLKRILNVAITRAKFKLYVIGDFKYCRTQGKKAFLGGQLLPYLQKRFPTIDARTLVPQGYLVRAAEGQAMIIGGVLEADSERTIMLQDVFYRYLLNDIQKCKEKIVIYSPFITPDRLSFLLPQLSAARERNVEIYVITKAHSERKRNEMSRIQECEGQLKSLGIHVIHKLNMHEKLIFFDDDILWSGSLNPLSFYDSREIMERRENKVVVKHYRQILRLDELLVVPGQTSAKCPVCGDEMIAAEGADDPYYWRCVHNNCFTRSIDDPYPEDGIIRCKSCGGKLEFGYWGEKPYWKCKGNNKHRLKIQKYHLKLPKMTALIPKKELSKIGKI